MEHVSGLILAQWLLRMGVIILNLYFKLENDWWVGWSLYMNQVLYQASSYPSFRSMNWLGLFLYTLLDASPL